MRHGLRLAFVSLSSVALLSVACGGGGGDDDPAPQGAAGSSASGSGGQGPAGEGGSGGTAGTPAGAGGVGGAGAAGSSPGKDEPKTTSCGALPPATSGVCDVTKGTSKAVVVRGRVVTPTEVFEGGEVVVDDKGIITCAACDCSKDAAYAAASKVVCADGVVTPSMINTHDHITFAQAAPRAHTVKYDHRHEWRKGMNGKPKISVPSGSPTASVASWGELRFAIAGATSTVGSGGVKGMLRNLDIAANQEGLGAKPVDFETFPLGDSSPTSLPTTCTYQPKIGDADVEQDAAFLPHMSEGVNASARNEFLCTNGASGSLRNFVRPQTAMIHAVGLGPQDSALMAQNGTAVIWSPRSNIDLYGFTAPVVEFALAGVQIALGTDWSASGSMNVLRELACADSYNKHNLGGFFSDYALFGMVTSEAASVTATADKLGAIKPGLFGDLTVWSGKGKPTFDAVIRAGVSDVAVVLRGGAILSGEADVVDALSIDGGAGCEALTDCLASHKVCAKRELGKSIAELQASISGELYPLYFCGAPDKEPSCVPSRQGQFTGVPSATDADGDGIDDASDLCPTVFSAIRPMDSSKQGDADGDGIGDACDPCALKANSTDCAPVSGDTDADGVPDASDNCPTLSNPDQADTDNDGKGDVCDPCPKDANPGSQACPTKALTVPEVKAAPDGTPVTVKGLCVTARRGSGSSFQLYVQDPTRTEDAGLVVFSKKDLGFVPGDLLDVTGTTMTYQGLLELATPTATKVSSGCTVTPTVVTPTSVATDGPDTKKYMSMLVTLADVAVTTAGDTSSGNEFTLDGALQVDDFLFAYAVADYPVGTGFASVTGILDYYLDHSKLCPRSAADLVKK